MASSYSVIYHPLAEKEYLESVSWYEENRTGLGTNFVREIEKVISQLEANPFLFPVKKLHFHEALVKIFPY